MSQQINLNNNNNQIVPANPPIARNGDLGQLPKDLLIYIFGLVGKISDVSKLQLCCKQFQTELKEPKTQEFVFKKFAENLGFKYVDFNSFKNTFRFLTAKDYSIDIFNNIEFVCSFPNRDCVWLSHSYRLILGYMRGMRLSSTLTLTNPTTNTKKTLSFPTPIEAKDLCRLDDLKLAVLDQPMPKIYDMQSAKLLQVYLFASPRSLISLSNNLVALVQAQNIEILDVKKNTKKIIPHTLEGDYCDDKVMAHIPGKLIFSPSTQEGQIQIWNYETLNCEKTLIADSEACCFLLCGDNQLISLGYADKNVKIWNLETGECEKTFSLEPDTNPILDSITFFKGLLVFNTEPGQIQFWNLQTGILVKKLELNPIVQKDFELDIKENDVELEGPFVLCDEFIGMQIQSNFYVFSVGIPIQGHLDIPAVSAPPTYWNFDAPMQPRIESEYSAESEMDEDGSDGERQTVKRRMSDDELISRKRGKEEARDDEISNNNNTQAVAEHIDTSTYFSVPTLKDLKKWGIAVQFFQELDHLQNEIQQVYCDQNPNAIYGKLSLILTSLDSMSQMLNQITLDPIESLKIKKLQNLKQRLAKPVNTLKEDTTSVKQINSFLKKGMQTEAIESLLQLINDLKRDRK